MADLYHQFGEDFFIDATGDLAVADMSVQGQQRVLRRLLTNPGDEIWLLTYGAGLAQFIGQPIGVAGIRAVIRGQIFKESAVARVPEPIVDVSLDEAGAVFVRIRYVDAVIGTTQTLSFPVNG